MLIAYLTTDEVNEDLAQGMAEGYGLALCPLSPRDPFPTGEFDAVVCDWDHLPVKQQQAVLTTLLSGIGPYHVALHGYNLEEHQAEDLRRHRVAVFRMLQPEIFILLRMASSEFRAASLKRSRP